MNLLMLILFCISILFLCFIEVNTYKRKITPLLLFAIPFMVIAIIQYSVCKVLGLQLPSVDFYFVCLYFTVLTLIFGGLTRIFSRITFWKKSVVNYENNTNINFLNIGLIFPLACLAHFVILMSRLSVIGQIVQEDFQIQYTSGIWFYFRILSMIYAVYAASKIKRGSYKIILNVLIGILPVFLTFVKGIIFIILVACLLANIIENKRKISLKYVVLAVIFGLCVFFGVYLVEECIWNPERAFQLKTYKRILTKLCMYLISGVQAFNINMESVKHFRSSQNIVYAPYVNFFHSIGLTKDRYDTIGDTFTVIAQITGYGVETSNTNTYIGMIYLYCGNIAGIIPHFINCFIVYLLYHKLENSSVYWKVAFALYINGFIFAWFDYYYMQTFWVYILIFCLILEALERMKLPRIVLSGNRGKISERS